MSGHPKKAWTDHRFSHLGESSGGFGFRGHADDGVHGSRYSSSSVFGSSGFGHGGFIPFLAQTLLQSTVAFTQQYCRPERHHTSGVSLPETPGTSPPPVSPPVTGTEPSLPPASEPSSSAPPPSEPASPEPPASDAGSQAPEFPGPSGPSAPAAPSAPGSVMNGGNGVDIMFGTIGNDLMNGGNGTDLLFGFMGDDTLNGGNGTDILLGFLGNDVLNGGNGADILIDLFGGNDTLKGGNGTDLLFAGSGNDVLYGDNGSDLLFGGADDDVLYGGNGSDWLFGGSGNDVLNGGKGDDWLMGGTGNDLYQGYGSGGNGNDLILDEGGAADVLDLSAFTSGSVRWFAVDTNGNGKLDQLVLQLQNNEAIFIQNFFDDTATTVAGSGAGTGLIESLWFSNGTVTFPDLPGIFNPQNPPPADPPSDPPTDPPTDPGPVTNTLNGSTGNDTFTLGHNFGLNLIVDPTGNDTVDLSAVTSDLTINLNSGDGAEVSDASSAGNLINWDSNAIENAVSGSGNDTLTGNADANRLDGGAGNDILNGGAGNDTLLGGTGDDTLIGGTGNDVLDGGMGNDVYLFDSGFGQDVIADAGGVDSLDFSGFSVGISVNLNLGNASVSGGGGSLSGLTAIENVTAGSGDDTLIGNAADNYLSGGAGNDNINGLLGNDTLDGGTGNDTMTGGGGNEYMFDEAGDDTYIFKAGFGHDRIHDLGGTDTLNATAFTLSNVIGWSAVDTNNDNLVDSLLMEFDANNSILIQDYFMNGTTSQAGAGYIESIDFADAPQMDLVQVQNLLSV